MTDGRGESASDRLDAGSGDESPTMPLRQRWVPGVVIAERFRLVRQLGTGGMGAVWLAHHEQLEIPCALKFLHEQSARSPEIIARFKREAKVAAQLRSPHVVQILDHGLYAGRPYIAMELLEGEDLAQRLRTHGRLDHDRVVAMAGEIARALTKAHAAGLVHRDLKPGNIFLVHDDDREITKILDFGIVKDARTLGTSTNTGALLGTPYYMSPEQLRSLKTIDHRADLWALAIVVYQCVVGKLPFPAPNIADLVVRIVMDPRPVPSIEARELMLPPSFDAWWARATHPDIDQRFQTAKEMVEALSVALGMRFDARATLTSMMEPLTAAGLSVTVAPEEASRSVVDSVRYVDSPPTQQLVSSVGAASLRPVPPRGNWSARTTQRLQAAQHVVAQAGVPLRVAIPMFFMALAITFACVLTMGRGATREETPSQTSVATLGGGEPKAAPPPSIAQARVEAAAAPAALPSASADARPSADAAPAPSSRFAQTGAHAKPYPSTSASVAASTPPAAPTAPPSSHRARATERIDRKTVTDF